MIKPLRHPDEFLALAAAHAPSAAASRACKEGNYTPPVRFTLPGAASGWRFTVTSQHGSTWLFSITVNECDRRYNVKGTKIK